ncbi:MAG TPA: glycosyltransferase [Thermomicrobiaceae bacterium]|nr:glycosyltransferase [Thermomicrobiaceae bacterium]
MTEGDEAPLPLAIVVLTRDEERHLPECLESAAGLACEVLVLDSGSRDHTVDIARAAGARVAVRAFVGYASQREAALAMVEQPWVLFLDADERLTPELRVEISGAIRQGSDRIDGYWIPRRNRICGRELLGGGWWPDEQLRLLRRDRAHYRAGREVHEIVDLASEAGRLAAPLVHLNYDTLAEFREKQARYARMRVDELRSEGRRPHRRAYLGQPAREFWRRFVTLGGYRDGWLGFRLAMLLGWYELRTLRWLAADRANDPPGPIALPEPGLDLSVVVVSYNVRDLVLACLASVEASLPECGLAAEVIVVDNASDDGTADAVRRRFPWVRLVEMGQNRGFAAGCNDGIRVAGGRAIVLLNPDTRIQGDALGVLARCLETHPEAGVAGPRVFRPDGSTQPTRRRFPTLLTGFLESTIVQDRWRDNRILRRYYVADRGDDEEQEVDWLVGACLAVRREAVETSGLLNEAFFMYSEEVEWCYRIRAAGWRVAYCPKAGIVHHEGASSRQDVPTRQVAFDTSKVLLFERLHGRWAARSLRAFLLASYLARMGIEGAKGLVGHKPALRRARVSRYARAFRSGLRPTRRVR